MSVWKWIAKVCFQWQIYTKRIKDECIFKCQPIKVITVQVRATIHYIWYSFCRSSVSSALCQKPLSYHTVCSYGRRPEPQEYELYWHGAHFRRLHKILFQLCSIEAALSNRTHRLEPSRRVMNIILHNHYSAKFELFIPAVIAVTVLIMIRIRCYWAIILCGCLHFVSFTQNNTKLITN